jgi:hypothetical protein
MTEKPIRNRLLSRVVGIASVAVLAGFPAFGILGPRAGISQRAVPIAFGLVWGLVGIRSARAAVICSPIGIRVLNPFRSYVVPWQEIESFSVGRFGFTPLMAYARLDDGSRLHLFAIQGGILIVLVLIDEIQACAPTRIPVVGDAAPA